MEIIDGMGQHSSQPPWLSEHDRYVLARAYYCFFCEQQNLPEEQREWPGVDDAIRIVLALFPELALFRGIAKPALDPEERDRMMLPAPAGDNIVYLR